MFCDKCGAKLNEGDAFCAECGAKVDKEATVMMTQSHTAQRKAVESVERNGQTPPFAGQTNQPGSRPVYREQDHARTYYQEPPKEKGGKDKMLYGFLGVLTVLLAIGVVWGVVTLVNLNKEEETVTYDRPQEAKAQESNPDLESEAEEKVVVTSQPTEAPAATAAPTAAPIPTQQPTPLPTQEVTVSDGDYVIPDSSTRLLSEADLAGLDAWGLRVARNEIYARHGRMFNDSELDAYFRGKSWYTPSIPADSFSDDILSQTEMDNAKLITQVEAYRGY